MSVVPEFPFSKLYKKLNLCKEGKCKCQKEKELMEKRLEDHLKGKKGGSYE